MKQLPSLMLIIGFVLPTKALHVLVIHSLKIILLGNAK